MNEQFGSVFRLLSEHLPIMTVPATEGYPKEMISERPSSWSVMALNFVEGLPSSFPVVVFSCGHKLCMHS